MQQSQKQLPSGAVAEQAAGMPGMVQRQVTESSKLTHAGAK